MNHYLPAYSYWRQSYRGVSSMRYFEAITKTRELSNDKDSDSEPVLGV